MQLTEMLTKAVQTHWGWAMVLAVGKPHVYATFINGPVRTYHIPGNT
jgi:hypothetical protein